MMVYLENKTTGQDVWIPRNDGDGYTHGGGKSYQEGYNDGVAHQKDLLSSTEFTENGDYVRTDGWSAVTVNVPKTTAILEDKDVTISGETTVITPSSGYDGLSSVTVDASELAQENYDDGFDDGFTDGYSSGSTDEKEKLSATTFTANTAVTLSDGGYSAVTVNVPQTGHTDQEMQAEYNLGYSDGVAHQKSLLSTTAITSNGEYTSENGWEEISVQVPQNNPNIEQSKGFTATTNGTSSITPSPIWEILFTSKESVYDSSYHFTIDGTISSGYYGQAAYRLDYHNFEDYGYVLIKIDSNGGLELDTSNYDQETEPVHLYYINGRYDFGGDRISASNFTVHPLNNVEYYYAMSSVTLTVDVPPQGAVIEQSKSYTATTNGSHTITPTGTWEVTCDTSRDDYYLFKIEGVLSGSQYVHRQLYRLDYNGEEDYGYILVVVNDNGDNLGLDINHYDQELHPVSYRNESDGTHFYGNPASAFTVTPLDYKEELYDAMAEVQLTVDVQPNVSSTAITENGTYEATGTGVDGWSSVTVNVPQTSYGELYCLECEGATFEIASANGLTQIELSMASAQFIGDWSGWANQGSERIATWTTNTREIDGVEKIGMTLNWGVPAVTATSPSYTAWRSFPDFYFGEVRKTSATTARMSIDNATMNVSGATMYPVTSVNILSNGYLKSANFNDTYCSLIPAVDSDGNACLYWNGQYIYPTFGSCYPVYKRTVDGVDKYVVVRDI